MKNALIIFGVILALLIILGFVFRDVVGFALMRFSLMPDHSFAQGTPPAAPDYADPSAWAALPTKADNADKTPQGVVDQQANASVDVFFIHPTTYYTSDSWNQPLDHAQANEFTDEQVLPNQASVFNSCCAVYVPRYRQATLAAFFDEDGSGEQAIEFAYQDIETAFDYFLEHHSQGRPFIIAGHSQGGLHADTLLRERIHGTPLAARLVAAYPVGFTLDGSNGVPVCDAPGQTGCQVTWNTLGKGAQSFQDTSNDICVNPLSWRHNEEPAPFESNLGGVSFAAEGEIEVGVTDAKCTNGVLQVSEVRSENYSTQMFGEGNYHIYDFSLFHMNIRRNAEAQVASYFASQP